MRDLVFSLLIGGSVVIGTTEVIGVTHVLEGQNPSEVVRAAVPDLPPNFPNSLIPDKARSMFTSDAAAAPDPAAAPGTEARPTMYIARTGGSGVRPRLACGDEAPGQGVVAEGTAVTILRQGGADCAGWALVSSGTFEFWVRMQFLDASAPKATGKPAETGKTADKAPPKDERKNEGDAQKDQGSTDDGKRKGEATPAPTASPAPAPTEPPATATATASPTADPTSLAGPKRPPKVPVRDEPKDEES